MSLTLKQAADKFQVSTRTLRREIADGKLARLPGYRIRISADELHRYLMDLRRVEFEALPKADQKRWIQEWALGPNPAQDALLTPESIQQNKRPFPYCGPAVYFLFHCDEVVYIGKAMKLWRRMGEHHGEKEFDGYSYIPCDAKELAELERRAILKYRPKLNRL